MDIFESERWAPPAALGRVRVNVVARARRLAFLVRHGQEDRLVTAMTAAAGVWGGAGGPILPVQEDGTILAAHIQIADTLRPDVFVDFTREGGKSALADTSRLPAPVVPARPLDDTIFWAPHQLAALTAADIGKTYLAIPPDEGLASAAGPGIVPQQDIPGWISAGVETYDTPNDAMMAIAQINGHTALELSRMGDRTYCAAEPFMATIGLIVITPDTPTFDDAVNFWNARALRPLSSRAVSVLMSEGALADRMVQGSLVEVLKKTSSTTPSAIVCSWSMSKGRLEKLVGSVAGLTSYEDDAFSEYLGRRPSASVTFRTQIDVRSFWLGRRETGIRNTVDVLVERPRTTLRMRAPMVPHSSMWGAKPIVVELSCPFIRGPKRAGVASLYVHSLMAQSVHHLQYSSCA